MVDSGNRMPDLDIKNDTGSIWVEHEGSGILIYFNAEIHPTLPPNHIRFNKQETMKLINFYYHQSNSTVSQSWITGFDSPSTIQTSSLVI